MNRVNDLLSFSLVKSHSHLPITDSHSKLWTRKQQNLENPPQISSVNTITELANYPPPQLLPLLQHPIATNPIFPGHAYQNVQVVEVRPMREHDVPCCGLGMGWFLFIIGFLFGGIPWYLGAFVILCTSVDHREKAGYVTCSIAVSFSLVSFITLF